MLRNIKYWVETQVIIIGHLNSGIAEANVIIGEE